jgi:hypothetical protein
MQVLLQHRVKLHMHQSKPLLPARLLQGLAVAVLAAAAF